jgi:hypothetical protein
MPRCRPPGPRSDGVAWLNERTSLLAPPWVDAVAPHRRSRSARFARGSRPCRAQGKGLGGALAAAPVNADSVTPPSSATTSAGWSAPRHIATGRRSARSRRDRSVASSRCRAPRLPFRYDGSVRHVKIAAKLVDNNTMAQSVPQPDAVPTTTAGPSTCPRAIARRPAGRVC